MRLAGSRPGRSNVVALVLAVVAVLAGGCTNFSQLQFHTDHLVKFTAPQSRVKVALPVRFRWQVNGFAIAGPRSHEPPSKDAGYFALFVDRAPVKPGQSLAAVAGDDPSCIVSAGCPDRSYLADHQVYTTTGSTFTLRDVDALDNRDNWQLHEITIVLLDSQGRRIGEHAYYRDFKLKRSTLS
jgi:hypothetical protein